MLEFNPNLTLHGPNPQVIILLLRSIVYKIMILEIKTVPPRKWLNRIHIFCTLICAYKNEERKMRRPTFRISETRGVR